MASLAERVESGRPEATGDEGAASKAGPLNFCGNDEAPGFILKNSGTATPPDFPPVQPAAANPTANTSVV